MNPLIWIIDEEWPDYDIEKQILTEKFKDCVIRVSPELSERDLESFGESADAVICQVNITISRQVIDRLKNCKIIAVYGVGYDKVDVKYAKEKGILVTNVPGYCNEDLSDYVMGAIYYFNKQLSQWQQSIDDGLWGAQAARDPVKRVNKSSLFIIGYGKIGKMTAEKANALGMKVMAYSPSLTQEKAIAEQVEKVEWEEGLARADYVSVHTPFNEKTASLVAYSDFAKMKSTAYFINTSRGGVINQKDLLQAVNEGLIAGAALDVLEQEPPATDVAILANDKILVTPHISYLSDEALYELKFRAAKNVAAVLAGEHTADVILV